MGIGLIAALQIWPNFPAHAISTTRFVDSAAVGTGTGATWANAFTTVTLGLAGSAAGDVLLCNSTHSVTANAALTWTPPAGGIAIISVTPSGAASYSAFTAGAAESVGTGNAAFGVAAATGSGMYLSGMSITGGTGGSSAVVNLCITNVTGAYLEMIGCTVVVPQATTAGQIIMLGSGTSSSAKIRARNCTFTCSGSRAGTFIFVNAGQVDLINPTFSITGGTKPTSLFGFNFDSLVTSLTIRDGDISGYAVSGGSYFLLTLLGASQILLKNVIISATPTLTSGSWPGGPGSITLRNVDSGNTNYEFEYLDAYGTLTFDSTVSKNSGFTLAGTAGSWKIVTTASANEYRPFISPIFQLWGTSTSAETGTVDVAQASGATNLNDRNCWVTGESATSATTTQYTFQTGRNAQPFVGTPVDWSASSATWTGLSTPNKQLLSLGPFTPARAGTMQFRVFVAAATTTVYVNPLMDSVS
jgi:hypothetical protein